MAEGQGERTPGVEEHLAGAATFMADHGIEAMYVHLYEEDRLTEGMAFMRGMEEEIGEILFVDRVAAPVSAEEQERRSQAADFVKDVISPVLSAMTIVYAEGSDLLDDRFDVLPGFSGY